MSLAANATGCLSRRPAHRRTRPARRVGGFLRSKARGNRADERQSSFATIVALEQIYGRQILAIAIAAALNALDRFDVTAVRLFTGLGIGGMLAATNAVVADYANTRRRNLAVAIMTGGYPIGAVIGGIIASSLLATMESWRLIFVFGALATAAFILSYSGLYRRRSPYSASRSWRTPLPVSIEP